ncbi:MAG: hypothetical protein CSA21_00765 [Deltaproteobacteria bacterium]|nr:MAG: hypothetical protein CSA21_00765 [Deltaproteobacteria bacterium]
MKQHKKVWAVLVRELFVALFLTFFSWNACIAGPKNSPPLIEPCTLLSRAEAEAIMGEPLKQGLYSEHPVIGQKLCLYEAADQDSFAFLNISLTQDAFISPQVLNAGQNARTLFTSIRKAFADREEINDLGEAAFIATPGIHVLKDSYYLCIGAGNLNRNKDKAIMAAKKAIANLAAAVK